MPLRTLIRIINQTYSARAIELKEMGEETTITLLEYTYDSILFRYGLQKVTDKKFISLLNGCLIYKQQSSRVRIFGRLLGLYDSLSNQDLRFYLEIVDNAYKLVLNFSIQEHDEMPLIPIVSPHHQFILILVKSDRNI
jgi:hypothetical protein